MILTSGGIGGNHNLVRHYWPTEHPGPAPEFMVSGVPAPRGRANANSPPSETGTRLINPDRMWHYTEGPAQLESHLGQPRHPGAAGAEQSVA